MVVQFAKRTSEIAPFRVMEVLKTAAELESAGHRVVHFEVGEPDFTTAAPIIKAGQLALANGYTKYTQATGIEPLRLAISAHYKTMGVSVAPEQICVTSGASAGLMMLSALLLNPQDELLITDPGYPCNEVFARTVGATPVRIPTSSNNRFQPVWEDLEAAWSAHTKGALLASPANPTGTMLEAEVLKHLAAQIRQRDGALILDEIYQGLVSEAPYPTGLSVTSDLFVLNSFSKFFGMTGWRLGWIVVPHAAIEGITKLAQNLFISPSTPAQYAALAAFEPEAMAIHESRAEIFRQRQALLMNGLKDLGFSIPVAPDGAFYLYVDVSHTRMKSSEFCHWLLTKHFVAVTPGEDFGDQDAQRYVRFAFTTDEDSIALGLQRLEQAMTELDVEDS
ncbi:MAG: aminotransferase class I/II-fold pyridoxal phosphate-dependent enzyme [Pseudomonadota bacterium]